MEKYICENCGAEVNDEMKYCPNCGCELGEGIEEEDDSCVTKHKSGKKKMDSTAFDSTMPFKNDKKIKIFTGGGQITFQKEGDFTPKEFSMIEEYAKSIGKSIGNDLSARINNGFAEVVVDSTTFDSSSFKKGIYKVTSEIGIKALPGGKYSNVTFPVGTELEVNSDEDYIYLYDPEQELELSFRPSDPKLKNIKFLRNMDSTTFDSLSKGDKVSVLGRSGKEIYKGTVINIQKNGDIEVKVPSSQGSIVVGPESIVKLSDSTNFDSEEIEISLDPAEAYNQLVEAFGSDVEDLFGSEDDFVTLVEESSDEETPKADVINSAILMIQQYQEDPEAFVEDIDMTDSVAGNKKARYVIDELLKVPGMTQDKAIALLAYHGSMRNLRSMDSKGIRKFKYLKDKISEQEAQNIVDYFKTKRVPVSTSRAPKIVGFRGDSTLFDGEFGLRWTEFDKNDRPVKKEKFFKSDEERKKFIAKVSEKDNFNKIEGYSESDSVKHICESCKGEVSDSASFCRHCGVELELIGDANVVDDFKVKLKHLLQRYIDSELSLNELQSEVNKIGKYLGYKASNGLRTLKARLESDIIEVSI